MVREFVPDKKSDFKASIDAKFFLWHTLAISRERCYGSVEVGTELHRTLSTFPPSLCKCERNNKSCWQLRPRLLAASQQQFEEHCEQSAQWSQHPLTISLVSTVTYRTCYFSPVSNPPNVELVILAPNTTNLSAKPCFFLALAVGSDYPFAAQLSKDRNLGAFYLYTFATRYKNTLNSHRGDLDTVWNTHPTTNRILTFLPKSPMKVAFWQQHSSFWISPSFNSLSHF